MKKVCGFGSWLLTCFGVALLICSLFLVPSAGLYADDPAGGGDGGGTCIDTAFQCSNAFYPCLGAEPKYGCKFGSIVPDCNRTKINDCKDCVCVAVSQTECLCKLP